MEEGNLEQRMQISSSGEEKDLAALMKLQKMCQSHLEGQKGQQGELTFLEVLCALRTPSLSQPLVMMMRRDHTGRNPPPSESPIAAAQRKRKGKNIRTASHEHSQGTREDDNDGEYEGISVLGPQPVESGDETHFNVRMRSPIDPEHRNIVNFNGRGMTERARKERENNLMVVGGRNLDYRFGTKFHQDYYASDIIKKNYPIARSEYIDWGFLSVMEDPKIAEIIRECKRKNVYDIMGFAKSWNN
jgi:hypothetical protein